MNTFWNAERLFETVATPDAAIAFCKERGLIADAPDCRYCRHPLTWSVKTDHADGFSWRCTHRGCRKRSRNCSIRHGSWFSDSKMSLKKSSSSPTTGRHERQPLRQLEKHQSTKVNKPVVKLSWTGSLFAARFVFVSSRNGAARGLVGRA